MKQEKKNWNGWKETKDLGTQFTKKLAGEQKDMLAVSIFWSAQISAKGWMVE